MNGVCVRWKGYLDLERLDGVGAIEFDEETANLEDAVMRDTVEAYNRRIKDFEEHNKARQRQLAAFMGHQQQVCRTVYFYFFSTFRKSNSIKIMNAPIGFVKVVIKAYESQHSTLRTNFSPFLSYILTTSSALEFLLVCKLDVDFSIQD